MKIFRKLLSLFLAFLFVLQLLPIKYIGNFAVKAFALETTESVTGYEFDIPKETNNTIDVDIPETFIGSPKTQSNEEICQSDKERLFKLAFENKYYSELSNEDKTFITNYYSLDQNVMDYFETLETKKFTILSSIYALDLIDKSNYDFSAFIKLNLSPNTTYGILEEFYFYLDNVKKDILGTSTDKIIRNYLLDGYNVIEVVNAYSISSVLEISMDALLNNDHYTTFETQKEIDAGSIELAETYSVSAEAINNYKELKDITKDDIESIDNNISLILENYTTLSDSEDSEEVVTTPYYYDLNDNEIISLNTGELTYNVIDYILPGKNGLDLVIGRTYSSAESTFYDIQPYYDGEAEDVYSFVNKHNDTLYSLGQGWAFAFTSIEKGGEDEFIHLSTGEVYKLQRYSGIKAKLVGYEYSDIDITTNGTDNICSCKSKYVVKYYDGREEHISNNGKLTCIKDRYGNTITLSHEYATWNKMSKITIVDTFGQPTIISTQYENDNQNNRTVTVTLPDGNILEYDITCSENSLLPAIASYTNASGNTTHYSYSFYSGHCFHHGSQIDEYNNYLSLSTITHPTYSQTIFEYDIAKQKLGNYHSIEYPRIKKRYDLIETDKYNEFTYEYIVNNKLHVDSATVTDSSGTKRKSTFNDRNKLTSVEIIYNGNVIDKTSFTYSSILINRTEAESHFYYNNSGISLENVTVKHKNDYNYPEKVWSTYAEGNTSNTENLTTYSYHEYGLVASQEYKTEQNTTVKIENTYSGIFKNIIKSQVLVNDVVIQTTDFTYDEFGNVLTEKTYGTDSNSYELTEYSYPQGKYLTQEKHTSVKKSDGTSAVGTSGNNDGTIVFNYTYDNSRRLASSTDGKGNTTEYEYDALGNITKITNPDNTTVTYTYNYSDNYVIVKDEKGAQIKYTYTPLGLEYETVDVLTGNVITRKEYDNKSRLIKVSEYIYGSVTEYEYDYLDRIISETVKQGNTVLSQTLYSYEYAVENGTYNKVTKTVVGDSSAPSVVTTEYTNKHGNIAKTGKIIDGVEYFDTYTYDYVGNNIGVLTAADSAKGLGSTSAFEYNHNGQVTKTTNANNQSTTNTYNEFGRLVTSTDYAGTPTGYTYDSLGRLTSQTITIENGKTSTTKYEYDAAGNIIREWNQTNAVGSVAAWNKTEYEYDNRNRLTSVKQYNGSTLASTTSYTYDGVGNVLTMTSGGKTTTYTYDRFGNVRTEKDALNNTKTYHYNGIGRLESVTDKNGIETEYFYDALGRILKTEATDSSGTEVQLFTYSKTGQVLSKANEDTTTSYTYDDLGRVETITELYEGYSDIPEYEDPAPEPNPEPEEPEPDPNPDPGPEPEPEEPEPGATFTVTLDPNGGTINYSTDSVTITVQNGDTYSLPTPTKLLTAFGGWYYGNELIENGDIVALTEDATFVARWSLGGGGVEINPPIIDPVIPNPPVEEMGEEEEEESSVFALREVTTQSYCKTYTYDLAGNRTGFTLEKGDETVHNISYSYDNLNRLSTVSENGVVEASYTYDANGNRASLTLGNGVTTTYSYNLANWVTNLSNKNSSGATLSSYAYTYYASGNQKSKTDNTGKVTSYVYDGLGRLTSESESNGVTLSYTYDSAGNRTKLTATGTESYVIDYTYNSVNQLTSEVKTESGSTETTGYTYDANGNMLSKTSPEGTQANTYNNLNQLVSSITAGVTSSYTYNVDGIRTSKTVGTATTDYLLDGGNVVAEAQNGDVTATYLRGANLLSTSTENNTSYYLFNAHGDVTGLTNGAQTVTKVYDYDTFGNEKEPSSTDENPFRYCGEYYDKETGTYYLRARYYDPAIGRFTQQDTHWNTANMIYGDNPNKINEREDALGLKAYTYTPSISSIMQSGNLYVYCGNNPISKIDPTGNEWWHWALGATVVVGCAVATVVTCGGFAAAATAVCMVGSGVAAATTASTVAAGAFIGSSIAYGFTVLCAAGTSGSIEEFNEQGNWGTVAVTAGGAIVGGIVAKPSVNTSNTVQPKIKETIKNDIIDLPRKGHALKSDPYHAFPNMVDNYAGNAVRTPINNGTLYQLSGSLNGEVGRFEWIVQDNYVVHRFFVKGGVLNGLPTQPQLLEKY